MSSAKEVYDPVFVTEEQALKYREQHDLDDVFPSEGWYFQVVERNVESEFQGLPMGSLHVTFHGPYETEQDALLDVPHKVPGVMVDVSEDGT